MYDAKVFRKTISILAGFLRESSKENLEPVLQEAGLLREMESVELRMFLFRVIACILRECGFEDNARRLEEEIRSTRFEVSKDWPESERDYYRGQVICIPV